MENGEAYMRGVDEGLAMAIKILRDYADEARADKRYQAANYLMAAISKIEQAKDYKPYA